MRGAGVFYSSPAYLEEPIMSRDCDFAGLSGGIPVDCHANNNLRWAKWRWVMQTHAPGGKSCSIVDIRITIPAVPMCAVPPCNRAVNLQGALCLQLRVAQCTEYRHAVFRAQGYHDLEGTPITLFSFIQAVCCLGLYPQT